VILLFLSFSKILKIFFVVVVVDCCSLNKFFDILCFAPK